MIKLLPCPFCDGKAEFKYSYHEDEYYPPRDFWHVRVECSNCEARAENWLKYGRQEHRDKNQADTEEAEIEVAKKWNHRACNTHDQSQARIRELEAENTEFARIAELQVTGLEACAEVFELLVKSKCAGDLSPLDAVTLNEAFDKLRAAQAAFNSPPAPVNGESEGDAFERWIDELHDDVVIGEYGYEHGEYTIYPAAWEAAFREGLTPKQAFDRALKDADGYRREQEEAQKTITSGSSVKTLPPSPSGRGSDGGT